MTAGGTFTEAIKRHENEGVEEAARSRRLSHANKKLLLLFLGSLQLAQKN
jgi:hypothetical protein